MEYENQLEKMDVGHEDEVDLIKMNHKDMQTDLEKQWRELEIVQMQEKAVKEDLEVQKLQTIEQMEKAIQQEKEIETKLEEKIKQISLLQQER